MHLVQAKSMDFNAIKQRYYENETFTTLHIDIISGRNYYQLVLRHVRVIFLKYVEALPCLHVVHIIFCGLCVYYYFICTLFNGLFTYKHPPSPVSEFCVHSRLRSMKLLESR